MRLMEFGDAKFLLGIRIELESLVTEREGMIAENKWCETVGNNLKYGEEQFTKVQNKIDGLLNILRQQSL